MGRRVTNLDIFQQGSPGEDTTTYVAIWAFKDRQELPNPGTFAGMWVNIKSGATYYNGTPLPSGYQSDSWACYSVVGNQATLGPNRQSTLWFGGSDGVTGKINTRYLEMAYGVSPEFAGTLDHFIVQWEYDLGDGRWYHGASNETSGDQDTYSVPSNAIGIYVHVTPVAKTYKQGDVDVPYWNGDMVSQTYYMSSSRPLTPSTPSVEMEDTTLTATIENISDAQTDYIQFEVYNDTGLVSQARVQVLAQRASYTTKVSPGGRYRVHCRSINIVGSTGMVYSPWTDFTDPVLAVPSAPQQITVIRANSSTSVYLEWTPVDSADTYTIEYATDINYFDGSNATTTVSDIETTHYEVTGLETGDEYFFRVCAVNDQGESGYTGIKSVAIGKPPTAPTMWSSSTTVITGDEVILYWVHNAEDGSKETYAQIEITAGGEPFTYTYQDEETPDDEEEKTKFYKIDTSEYIEGTKIMWRVRTAGITKEYGDWSVKRQIDVYAQPTLSLSVTNQNGDEISTVTTFPIFIKGLTGPKTQMPIGYHVSIVSNSAYDTIDTVGQNKHVKSGEAVYDTQIDTNDALLVELSPNNIDLQNGITYTITVIASMNSGLTVETSKDITVSWEDVTYDVDASIGIDRDSIAAYITPYATDPDDNYSIVSGVHMSVYRREFDGTYTEIATGVDPTKNTVVVDPHPALDYARYRIVAIDDATGAVSYYDPPAWPIGETSIVIQWDEEWSEFDGGIKQIRSEAVHTGSMLKLPYNVDISDSNTVDMTTVNYIGRTYPVSYYGTAIDSTSTWNSEIPAYDTDTIYQLRRLQIWKGDVYVREPSGTGYWASINVSFNITHCELTIPITIDITRVEGGI